MLAHARTHLDFANDFEAILSLEEDIESHVTIPVLDLVLGEEELVLDPAHTQARLVLRLHE